MALGIAEVGDCCSSLVVVVVDSWLGELSCGNSWWAVKFAGTRLFVECAGETREKHLFEVAHHIGVLTILE